MIPLKLQLKNFLSYGPTLQTIDFTPYPLICLSGKNGHGKSALLDAITWAIWGQARKISGVAKADGHLLRLGQSQMLVIFDFEFNGQYYRIRREYAVTFGKQYASLDFGLVQNDKNISLTDKTIRETQTIIETTLGLDFEAFINSAFLRQGQSNEFSKKSPKERKDILGTILGLSHYELLRKRAVDKVKHANNEIMHLSKFQEKIETELQKLPELTTSLLTINQCLDDIVHQEKNSFHRKIELDKEKEHLVQQRNQQNLCRMNYNQKLENEQELQQILRKQHEQWKITHKKFLGYVHCTDIETQRQQLHEQITQHQQILQKNLEIKEKFLNVKQKEQQLVTTIKAEYQKNLNIMQIDLGTLQTELTNKKNHRIELEKQQKNNDSELLHYNHDSATLQAESSRLEYDELHVTVQERQFEKRKMFYHQWVMQANLIKVDGDNLQKKQKLTADDTNPSCPLCEQNLSASRKKFLKTQFLKQEQFLRHRLYRLTILIKELKIMLVDQHAYLEKLKKNNEQKKIIQIKLDELCKLTIKIQTTQMNLEEQYTIVTKEISNLEQRYEQYNSALTKFKSEEQALLLHNQDYLSIQTELASLEHELNKKIFDQQAYQRILNQAHALEQQRTQAHEVQKELSQQQERKQHIHELCLNLKTIKLTKNEIAGMLKGFDYLEQQMHIFIGKEADLTATLSALQEKKETLLQQKGSLENERIKLSERELEHKTQQARIKELNNLSYDYQAIATAVSKDGIQALIIEDALPEIEQEANTLLGQLTDNQAHIIIESLRDLKKGGTKETLDIKISDAAGIRPYELFSGGEAFRIDFALRLAISKLLARRAGTSLQTLIIDEGFGSQDEDGLAHIMEALYKIQENFCKIIIVSHLPAMKDQFPVHFFIEKGSQGSTVRVIEQG